MKNQKLIERNKPLTYRFEVDDKGNVEFLLATGSDFAKNSMTLEHAKNIAYAGEVTKSDVEGYPICVSDKWYFVGTING